MKRYTFTLRLTGVGITKESAWIDAVEATCLEDDPPPLEFTVEEEEEDDDE
jgi:hypothetical protein